MNQSLSDDTLWSDWSNSQDSGFEGGWKEIYAEAGGKADSMTLFAELLRLYREGMAQELAAAIEAFVDFTEHQPDAYGSEVAEANDFRTDKIAPLVDLWNPFGPEEAAYVATVAQHLWPSAFDPSFLQQRRARVLLQALGLLDIDFVREARRPVFRSWGQKPQVVQMVDCLTGRQCSECRHLIRSFHFYECQNGCKDEDGHIDMFKVFPKESGPRGTARYISPEYHWYSARKAFDMRQYRVCPACLPKSSHPRSHLRALRGYTKAGDQVALGFARELDLWEDDLDGRFMESLGVNALDKLASVNRLFAKTSSRHFFPAGNAHCALMFGPLLIENGMTRHPGGASISRRPLVNFTASSNADLQEFMSEPTDYHPYKGKSEVLHQRHLSYAANKHLYQADLPIRARRFVTCRKQVSGGLFTNYCDRFAIDEALIVLEFTKMAESWQTIKIDRTQTQKEYRAQLLQRGQYLAELIFETFGEEIRRSLLFFASRLHKEVKLQYNRLSNNCQDFCNELLIGHDKWDSMFNRIYPPVPVNLEQNENTYCIRYMMSFASRMLHPLDEMPFVDPVASSTQLYDTFGHNDADILDHIANIRYKEDPEGSGLTMPDSCHDPFLLKGRDTTCFQNSSEICSLADHLLDGPHDNLSVLTIHIHRDRSLYTVPTEANDAYEEFLVERGSREWVQNRLEVLHRLYMLNTLLALVSRGFQEFTQGLVIKYMHNTWSPPRTLFGRAWPSNKRIGDTLEKPTWHQDIYGDGQGNGGSESRRAYLVMISIHTHPFMQSDAVWKVQLKSIKDRIRNISQHKVGLFPNFWVSCQCKICTTLAAETNCLRARSYAASLEHLELDKRVSSTSHPDYVSMQRLLLSIQSLGICEPVIALLRQLWRTPSYFHGNEGVSFWRELGISEESVIDELSRDANASADTATLLNIRLNRSVSSIVDDYFG